MDFSIQWNSCWLMADASAVPEPQELLVCCARLNWPVADSVLIRGVLQPALLAHPETNLLLLWWTPPSITVWFSGQGRDYTWQRKAIKQWLLGNNWPFIFYAFLLTMQIQDFFANNWIPLNKAYVDRVCVFIVFWSVCLKWCDFHLVECTQGGHYDVRKY